MPKLMVTWLGEDELHSTTMTDRHGNEHEQAVPGPSFNFWGDIRFDKGQPVLIDNEAPGLNSDKKLLLDNIVKRAPNMKRYKVEPVQERHERQSKG